MRNTRVLLVCLLLLLCGASFAQARQRILLDANWRFSLASDLPSPVGSGSVAPTAMQFDDSGWRIVHLPHDYVVEGKFDPNEDGSHGFLPRPKAWYRKSLLLPSSDKGKSVWIDFDGVYRDSVVYLNGIKLGEFQSGYAPFRYDISKAAIYGANNILAVSVDPTSNEGWFYEGAGIYRHVWLNVASPVHVAPYGTYVVSKLAEPVPGQPVPPATIVIQTTLDLPGGASSSLHLSSVILDPSGQAMGSVDTSASGLTGPSKTITQSIFVNHPVLWSLEKTSLYTLDTTVSQGQGVVDTYRTTFGIRTIRFDANNGFFLNGLPVKIKGVCNHQDFAGVGIGVPDSLEYWRVRQLKSFGCNGWRTSHNPPTSSVLDACDKLGMLVMDENRHLGDTYEPKTPPGTPYSDMSDLDAMILRDRNHPSIILWSLCNEEFNVESKHEGAVILEAMRENVHAVDPTRPVTCAMDFGYNTMDGESSAEDIQGINYHPWDYATFHQQNPLIPLYGSETGSTVSTRGVYSQDQFTVQSVTYTGVQDKGWVSAYDVNRASWSQTAETSWPVEANEPYVAGGFIWTGFDYKGEPTPFAWPDINSNFGILDEAGFPKDNYYYYKAWWTAQPLVHILPHWNWAGKEGQPIPVWVYSNAASVDLVVNGVSQGKQTNPVNGHVAWNVPYAPGTVVANGYDTYGHLIASDDAQTTGAPASIKLIPDRFTLFADGEDVVPVEVDVVDSAGRIVPDASTNRISFYVTGVGTIAGVGNGNPSDHDPDQSNNRLVFNGKALVLVGGGERPGAITLTATSDGLSPASVTFTSLAGSSSN
jgi:beta-galactosidase